MCKHLTNPQTSATVDTEDTDLFNWLIQHGWEEDNNVGSAATEQGR